MIKLKAPRITDAQRKALTAVHERLTKLLGSIETGCKAIADLRKKERKLEKERNDLNHGAANFDRDAEIKLAATLKQIERIYGAIAEVESQVYDWKNPLFCAQDEGREQIAKICQATYQELLDLQANALAPFWENWHNARETGKNSPAIGAMVRGLLTHRVAEFDSVELLDQNAREVLATIDAILNGAVVWQFEGAKDHPKASAAAA